MIEFFAVVILGALVIGFIALTEKKPNTQHGHSGDAPTWHGEVKDGELKVLSRREK